MSLLLGFLTFILVVDSIFLILLILIQLPKKEAGIGVAFGASATDALFGAGSGTVLTKVTKRCAAVFLGLSLALSVMNAHISKQSSTRAIKAAETKAVPGASVTPPANVPAPSGLTAGTNLLLTTTNLTTPAAPSTNAAPVPAK